MTLKDKAAALLAEATRERVPGAIALATDRTGTLYEGAAGRRALDQDQPMTVDTVCAIFSMTKAVTTAAALALVEEGRLSLDAPLKQWLPPLGSVKVLDGFEADGTPRLRERRGEVTLRQLLTHTSGFGYDIWNEDLVRCHEALGIPGIVGCQNLALSSPLLFDPGTDWTYGIGIDWAGKAVEAASGMKLGAFFQSRLFEPLGMTDTAFRMRPDMRQRRATIHARAGDALLPQPDLEIPQEPEFEMGGGGLYGTAADYARFLRMILNQGRADDGRVVLKPETVALMSTNQMGALRMRPLPSAMPPFSHALDVMPGIEKTWSTGFMINLAPGPAGRSAGSLAWAGLANTYYWIDPARGVAGLTMTQIIPFLDPPAVALFEDFERAVYASLA